MAPTALTSSQEIEHLSLLEGFCWPYARWHVWQIFELAQTEHVTASGEMQRLFELSCDDPNLQTSRQVHIYSQLGGFPSGVSTGALPCKEAIRQLASEHGCRPVCRPRLRCPGQRASAGQQTAQSKLQGLWSLSGFSLWRRRDFGYSPGAA